MLSASAGLKKVHMTKNAGFYIVSLVGKVLFDGTVTTFSTSSSVELILCGSEGDEWFLSFFLREGRMVSFLGSRPIYLRYTESSLGTGRTLSLMVGEDKIVLKEVK